MNILDEIAAYTASRVEVEKTVVPPDEMRRRANRLSSDTGFPFEAALKQEGLSFICEVKRASPSKGLIAESFPYLTIAKEYESAGASALSVLTESRWFGGSLSYLREIASAVKIPVLRKDFTVDPYMIDQAKVAGASAILLICSLLDDASLVAFLRYAHDLGLSALVEAHDEREVDRALNLGARIIGVNNRDLKTFTVDVNHSTKYRKIVPADRVFVSESGIKTRADVEVLEQNGTDAVLIGETLMRCKDKKAELDRLSGR